MYVCVRVSVCVIERTFDWNLLIAVSATLPHTSFGVQFNSPLIDFINYFGLLVQVQWFNHLFWIPIALERSSG